MRRILGLSIAVLTVASLCLLLSAPLMAQPRPMEMDVFTPIAKGYDLLREGKYDAAEYQFRAALQKDRYNPFALNNLAAIMENKGKLKEALAYLSEADTHAKEYYNKIEQTCFIGGLCNAVKPVKEVGPTSVIAPVIAENMKKLKDKVAATPMKPEPSTPPPMGEKKK